MQSLWIGTHPNRGSTWLILRTDCGASHHFCRLIVMPYPCLWQAKGPCPLLLIGGGGRAAWQAALSAVRGGGWHPSWLLFFVPATPFPSNIFCKITNCIGHYLWNEALSLFTPGMLNSSGPEGRMGGAVLDHEPDQAHGPHYLPTFLLQCRSHLPKLVQVVTRVSTSTQPE